MKCPSCDNDITAVNVYSNTLCTARVDDNGVITLYNMDDAPIIDTDRLECQHCGYNLTDIIAE